MQPAPVPPHNRLPLLPLLISDSPCSKDSTDFTVSTTVNIKEDKSLPKRCSVGCLAKGILRKILVAKDILTALIVLLIFAGLVYNFIVKDEKDIPAEVFENLYKLAKTGSEIPKSETLPFYSIWLKKIRKQNSSRT